MRQSASAEWGAAKYFRLHLSGLREKDVVFHMEIAVEFSKEFLQIAIEFATLRICIFGRVQTVAFSPNLMEH